VDIFNWYGDTQDELIPAAGKGHWNDPDMVSGISLKSMLRYSLSFKEQKAQVIKLDKQNWKFRIA